MPTKEVTEIPGPVIAGRPRTATVTIKRHRVTARVGWDVGGIDLDHDASEAFARRLEAAGMSQALHRWIREHAATVKPRVWLHGGARWGHVRNVPIALVDDLAELVTGLYRAAVVDLPLTDAQETVSP